MAALQKVIEAFGLTVSIGGWNNYQGIIIPYENLGGMHISIWYSEHSHIDSC
jgi:hypothetical protein